MRVVRIILCIILVGIMAFSGYQIWKIQSEYSAGEHTYEDLVQYAVIPSASVEEEETEEPAPAYPVVDFEPLRAINSDVVGWIYIEGTNINYPVVQGQDNDYYLNRLFTREWNSSGSIFMDYRNQGDFSDPNTIIYGHQMNNKTMFNQLERFQDQAFCDSNPEAYLVTPEKIYAIRFFSAYVANVEQNAWELNFTGDGFAQWLEEIQSRSCFTTQVVPSSEDHVVTLSTCSKVFDNARFVVHGILEEVQ